MRLLRLLLVSALPFVAHAKELQRSASLVLPDVVRCSKSCMLYDLPIEMQIRWMEETELSLDLYVHDRKIKVGPYVEVEVSTEKGEKLPVMFFMSMPNLPHGKVSVRKGEVIRFYVYPWNGIVTFPKEGRYRLKARLSAVAENGDTVVFQTNEREVTVELEEKNQNQITTDNSGAAPLRA